MQDQSFFSNLCHSPIDYYVTSIREPERSFRFEYCFIGDRYLIGREKLSWKLLTAKDFILRSHELPTKTNKSLLEVFLSLNLPKKISVINSGQVLQGWLIAVSDIWICLEITTGRVWLNMNALSEVSLGTVDN
jgi:hypothetical protein